MGVRKRKSGWVWVKDKTVRREGSGRGKRMKEEDG